MTTYTEAHRETKRYRFQPVDREISHNTGRARARVCFSCSNDSLYVEFVYQCVR